MARMQLKERQFEPTGVNLGDFESKDLETFDLQFKDSDKEGGQDDKSDKPSSHVPDPIDDNPLKDDSGKSSSGEGDDSKSPNPSQEPKDSPKDRDEGLPDIPDEWDPYGKGLDQSDPDMPDPIDNDDDDMGYGGGEASDSEVNQPTTSGGSSDEEGDGEDSETSSGDGQGEEASDSQDGSSGSQDSDSQSDGTGNDGDAEGSESDGNRQGDESSSDSSGDSNSMSNGANSVDSDGGQGEDDSGGDSGQNQQGDATETQGGGDSKNSSDTNSGSAGKGTGLEYDPNDVEDDDDDDFDPAGDIKSISDLEKALEQLEKSGSNTAKEKRESEREQEKKDEQNNRNNRGQQQMRDKQEEAAAAKEILSKAIQDKKERDKEKSNSDDFDEPNVSSDIYESEDDILKDLGAGNLTTLFNPNNARDWRVQLDRLFDSALGLDVVTNPNLVNKKIEDAPPGREDYDPVIKNIVILLDYSGSMGAVKFKQVISHIDTMLKARKLTKTTFHIFPWGTTNAGTLLDRYTKCKGLAFKRTINSKFKSGSGGTDLAPVIPIVMKKVHKPDAIIVMTDGEINDPSTFNSSPMCKQFIRKYKKRIIWALTSDGNISRVTEFDPTAKAKKRFIKFKRGGGED